MHRYLVAAIVACGIAAATVLAAQDYPHAFPRKGVTQLFDNPRVTVWEVNWINGVKQPIHRHRYDMAGVYLRYGVITVTTPDGNATTGQPFDVPRPYFQPKGVTHREEATGTPGDPERLAIMVDLKDNFVPPLTVNGADPKAFPRDRATNVLENARVRMWDYTWKPGAPTARHTHDTDTIEVFVTGGRIRTRTADGKEETHDVAFKNARWVPRGRVDTEEAVSGAPRAIVIELK
ncbi:MAG: hypothetical protein LAO77_16795 [Acidobacteriia bacterium]|nr:hypothetical protein [Terriglobia bacterium]